MADNARSGSFAQRHRVRRALCLRTPYVPAWQHLRIRSRRSIERKKNRLSFHWRHGSKSAGSTHFFFGPAKQVCHRPSNCAARQDTYVLTADNILKTKHGLQDTQILLTKTKMPTSLVQEGWRKLFGWRLLNHRLGRSFGRHWLDLVTLQGLVHCLHLLFVDLNVWCLDTKNPFRQQSALSSTFGRRPDEQARFPIRHLKLQSPWWRVRFRLFSDVRLVDVQLVVARTEQCQPTTASNFCYFSRPNFSIRKITIFFAHVLVVASNPCEDVLHSRSLKLLHHHHLHTPTTGRVIK